MIFCVEDDDSIRELMVYALTSSGFKAAGFADGPSFWQAMEQTKPELVLLDIMLPGEDGVSILRRLRAAAETESLPVIMATAKGAEYDKVRGLDSGADDYLVKPFGMLEMVSRVKAVLRRSLPREQAPLLRCGEIAVDRARHLVTVQNSCFAPSGVRNLSARAAPWMCISEPCAPSWARPANTSPRSGALAINWR